MDIYSAWFSVLVAAGLVLGMLLAVEAGFRLGRRMRREVADKSQVGTVQGAVLALLGLLLGFSFAGAAGRYVERQDLIVREANAVGTAYLRADLLDDGSAPALRSALRRYTAERLELFAQIRPEAQRAVVARLQELQREMWAAGVRGVNERPGVVMAVLPPLNEVIDLFGTRQAATRRHLPGLVMGLLVACAAAGCMAIGFGCGLNRERHTLITTVLTLLLATTLWTTLDLDYPRRGLVRVDATPLREALEGMGEAK